MALAIFRLSGCGTLSKLDIRTTKWFEAPFVSACLAVHVGPEWAGIHSHCVGYGVGKISKSFDADIRLACGDHRRIVRTTSQQV